MLASIASLTLIATLATTSARDLDERWRDWIEMDVGAFISQREKDYFLSLASDDERERFIEAFWRAHDPTTRTRRNEFREEIGKRVAYAESHFGGEGKRQGARSDRGRMYVLFGEPQVRRDFPSSVYGLHPTELWFYQAPKGIGLPAFFYLIFFKRNGVGDYQLYSPVRDGPEALLAAGVLAATSRSRAIAVLGQVDGELQRVSLSLDPGSGASETRTSPDLSSELLLAKIHNLPNSGSDTSYLDKLDLSGKVETVVDYAQVSLECELWSDREGDGTSWVHYQVVAPAELVRVIARSDEPFRGLIELDLLFENKQRLAIRSVNESFAIDLTPQQSTLAEGSPLTLQGKLSLIPESYRVSFLLRNKRTGQFGVAEMTVEVADLPDRAPALGAMIVASEAQPLDDRGDAESHPFAANGHKLLPMRNRTIASGRDPWLLAQMLYPAGSQGQRLAKTITVVPAASTQAVQTSVPQPPSGQAPAQGAVFDYRGWLTTNPDLDGGVANILESLKIGDAPPGDYTVVLQIEDEGLNRVAESRQMFTIAAVEQPEVWTLSRAADRGERHRDLARQFLVVGDRDRALVALDRIHDESDEKRSRTAAMLLELNEPSRASALLAAVVAKADAPAMAHLYAALSYALQGQHRTAAAHYEQALRKAGGRPSTSLLNALGEAYANAGEVASARRAFERSIEIEPDQPKVKAALAKLSI